MNVDFHLRRILTLARPTMQQPLRALLVRVLLCSSASGALAQTTPPTHIQPGPADKMFVLCTVRAVNEDRLGYLENRVHNNLWTLFMRGGKFEATGPEEIRVLSASPNSAAQDVYGFYKSYAAAALIRGPEFDRGVRNIDAIVKECHPEPGRTSVGVASAPPSAYRSLDNIFDHLYAGLRSLGKTPSPEELAVITNSQYLPADAFERHDEVEKRAKLAQARISQAVGPLVTLTGDVHLNAFEFGSGTFTFHDLRSDAESYRYSMEINKPRPSVQIRYDLIVPPELSTIKPQNVDDAKRIEKLRAGNQLRLTSFVQITGAVMQDKTLTIKGTLAAVELRGSDGHTVARSSSR